jgi:hypothetical protein
MIEATASRSAESRLAAISIDDAKRYLSGGEKQDDRDDRREQKQKKRSKRRNGLVYRGPMAWL